jgi:diacylglycerol kinase (ATP)
MPRFRIVVNPMAGKGHAKEAVPRVKQLLEKHNIEFDMVYTERPWHACELTKQAAGENVDVVVAMGGDGTANEVLNGLMEAKKIHDHCPAMGVICVGRGNDFAYGVHIPHDLEAGCTVLAKNFRRKIDVGHVAVDGQEGRYFGNGIGIGFDAVVGFEAAKMKYLSGFLGYAVAAFKVLFLYYKAPTVEIEFNNHKIVQSSLMVSVMNGRRMGGGFYMAPTSLPNDGLFDLCIAGVAGHLRVLSLIFHFMKGTQVGKKCIQMEQASRLTVAALEGMLPAHADGETLCVEGKHLKLKLLPDQIEVLCAHSE